MYICRLQSLNSSHLPFPPSPPLSVSVFLDLESVIQSEVGQKEKNKYYILTHIYGILKNGVDELICRAGIETDVENRLMDTEGAEKGGVI